MTIVVLSVLIIQLTASPQGRPWTEQYRDEAAAANRACDAKEFMECRANLLLLKELLDGRADIIYRLATVEASLGNRIAATEWLSLYSKMGLHLIAPPSDAPFSSFNDSAEFQAVMARLVRNAAAVATSRLFAKLPENDLIAEDITYDTARRRFCVSSVRHRKILSLTADGTVSDFIADAEWPILALGVDSRRRIRWATTVALPEGLGYNPADEGKSAVLLSSILIQVNS